MPCKINRRSEWTGRILLEMQSHENSTFCTLTYSDSHLPSDGLIKKRDVQLFLKKLRRKYAPKTIRYFATGEYGSQTSRAHYHLILFGFCPLDHHLVTEAWGKGFTTATEVNSQRAAYVAKYTTKDNGPTATFGMMSRRPGIGRKMAVNIAASLKAHPDIPIPNLIRIGKKKYIMGKYMSEAVKTETGLEHPLSNKIVHDLKVNLCLILGDPLQNERIQAGYKAENLNAREKMREQI